MEVATESCSRKKQRKYRYNTQYTVKSIYISLIYNEIDLINADLDFDNFEQIIANMAKKNHEISQRKL